MNYSNPSIYDAVGFQKKSNVYQIKMQIKVRRNEKFDDVNRNNVNRGYVNRRITVLDMRPQLKHQVRQLEQNIASAI